MNHLSFNKSILTNLQQPDDITVNVFFTVQQIWFVRQFSPAIITAKATLVQVYLHKHLIFRPDIFWMLLFFAKVGSSTSVE